MITIVTIHGTFATGQEEGRAWWQKGGYLQQAITDALRATPGVNASAIQWLPFVWSGVNSEKDRRDAGKKLAAFLQDVDSKGGPYWIIAHSHGGSVLAHALLNLAASEKSLPNLKRWLTVGTPFFKFGPTRGVYSRLPYWMKIIFLSVIIACVLSIASVIDGFSVMSNFELFFNRIEGWLIFAALSAPPSLLYAALFFLQRRTASRKSNIVEPRGQSIFQSRFTPLWHRDDEAILALSGVQKNQIKIFSKTFVADLAAPFVIVFPVAMLLALLSLNYTKEDMKELFSINEVTFLDFTPSNGFLYFLFHVVPLKGMLTSNNIFLMYVILVVPLLILAFSMIVLWLGQRLVRGIAIPLSSLLNSLSTKAGRASAYGNDIDGEIVEAVSTQPHWLLGTYQPLDQIASANIVKGSDASVAMTLPMFRELLRSATESESGAEQKARISECLTSAELVHNRYFGDPAVQRLLTQTIIADLKAPLTPPLALVRY